MKLRKGQLVAGTEAKPTNKQHTKPCGDCPWRRDSLPGWLGSLDADDWIRAAHGEAKIDCHTKIGPQCAGAAIYRRNICKSVRDPNLLKLDSDFDKVFANPMQFKKHHTEN